MLTLDTVYIVEYTFRTGRYYHDGKKAFTNKEEALAFAADKKADEYVLAVYFWTMENLK